MIETCIWIHVFLNVERLFVFIQHFIQIRFVCLFYKKVITFPLLPSFVHTQQQKQVKQSKTTHSILTYLITYLWIHKKKQIQRKCNWFTEEQTRTVVFSRPKKHIMSIQAGVFLCWCVLILFFAMLIIAVLMKLNPNRCLPRRIIRIRWIRKFLYLDHVEHLDQGFSPHCFDQSMN